MYQYSVEQSCNSIVMKMKLYRITVNGEIFVVGKILWVRTTKLNERKFSKVKYFTCIYDLQKTSYPTLKSTKFKH